ncbi:MAG: NAD(P)H-hydrate epimerase, partial [Oligoflexia bacterium]|nr:NAD(P)H-hydrate epimerase [Oligoflexia bacterium]
MTCLYRRVVNVPQMREVERVACERYGLTESLIIENVGVEGAWFIQQRLSELPPLPHRRRIKILALIGKGNNGADALSIARQLLIHGCGINSDYLTEVEKVEIDAWLLYEEEDSSPALKQQIALARAYGVNILQAPRNFGLPLSLSNGSAKLDVLLLLDGILGTGLKAPLTPYLQEVIVKI